MCSFLFASPTSCVIQKYHSFWTPGNSFVDGQLSANNLAHYHMSFVDKVPEALNLQPPTSTTAAPSRWGERIDWTLNRFKPRAGKQPTPPIAARRVSVGSGLYQYKNLKGFRDIRLFELDLGKEDEPLRGTIRETPLQSAEHYSALSYRWGSELKPSHIRTGDGLVPITVSLDAALRRLREPNRKIVIWADAICIDQANKTEIVV